VRKSWLEEYASSACFIEENGGSEALGRCGAGAAQRRRAGSGWKAAAAGETAGHPSLDALAAPCSGLAWESMDGDEKIRPNRKGVALRATCPFGVFLLQRGNVWADPRFSIMCGRAAARRSGLFATDGLHLQVGANCIR